MKYLISIGLIVLFSCSEKHKEESGDVEWKEMDDFHSIMADVYHPLKDSNNLEPIKEQADDLATAATKWKDSKLPSKVDNDEIKEKLDTLQSGTQQLVKAIKDGDSDEAIAAKLTILHDTFHAIMESYYQAGKKEGAEEHR